MKTIITKKTISQKEFAKLKLSAKIRHALHCVAQIHRDKRYAVDMSQWHYSISNNGVKCSVCLAGAVMAKSFNADINETLDPAYFIDAFSSLEALEDLRMGDTYSAFHTMGLDPEEGIKFKRLITRYEFSPKRFRNDMLRLARDLEKAGY